MKSTGVTWDARVGNEVSSFTQSARLLSQLVYSVSSFTRSETVASKRAPRLRERKLNPRKRKQGDKTLVKNSELFDTIKQTK